MQYFSVSYFLSTFLHVSSVFFLQDGETDLKYFVLMDTNFFIYNALGGETFCTLFELFM